MAEIVYMGISGHINLQGTLFQGKKFWLSQKVPQRSRFIADIKANGGEVLPVEKHADIKIVDHARKEALPGTYSYTYIERSIRNGVLEDLEDHAVGPPAGTVRSVGSIIHPAKTTRTKFTPEDDQILWLWVEQTPQQGGGTDGNIIYKQLEAKNPRHTWQSWRDRWVKHLKGMPRPAFVATNAPPTPPHDPPPAEESNHSQVKRPEEQADKPFSAEDVKTLLSLGEDILNIHPDNTVEAWVKWAQEHDSVGHSAQEWQDYWTNIVRPIYMKRKARLSEENAISKTASVEDEVKSVPQRSNPLIKAASKAKPVERTIPDQPESPSNHATDTSLERVIPHLATEEPEIEILPLESPQNQLTSVPNPMNNPESHKRKPAFFDDEELPSSSPPEMMPSSSKRQRRSTMQERPIEIASTPEGSPAPYTAQPKSEEEHDGRLNLDDVTTPEGFFDDVEDFEDLDTHFGGPPSQSLSSPEHTTLATRAQAAFVDPTQYIDFNVPPPEDGWSDDDPLSNQKSPTSSQPPATNNNPNATHPDTQALLTSKTQLPDFSVPTPSGGWDPSPASSPPPNFLPPPASPTQSQITADLDAWIDARIAAGHAPANVELALRSTSMDAQLAAVVLEEHLQKGQGLPKEMRGVWTEEDDADLEATDARRLGRVERKHGGEAVGLRWEFLGVYKWGDGEGEG